MLPIQSTAVANIPASSPVPPDPGTLLIREQVRFWCEDLPARDRVHLAAQWTALHESEAATLWEDQQTGTQAIFKLFHRIASVGDGLGRATDAQRATVVALLHAMLEDDAFRDACCAQAVIGAQNCADNALSQFEKLGVQLAFRTAQTPAEFVLAARAAAVDTLLRDFIATKYPEAAEPLEIQRYITDRLTKRLRLPEANLAHFHAARAYLGENPGQTVRDAYRHLRQHLDQEVTKTLLGVPKWESFVQERHGDALRTCMAPLQDAMAAWMETDASGALLMHANELNNSYHRIEASALKDLTGLFVLAARPKTLVGRLRELLSCTSAEQSAAKREAALLRSIADDAAIQANRWSPPAHVAHS